MNQKTKLASSSSQYFCVLNSNAKSTLLRIIWGDKHTSTRNIGPVFANFHEGVGGKHEKKNHRLTAADTGF